MTMSAIRLDATAVDVTLTNDQIVVILADGRSLSVPLAWSSRLANATPAQRKHWRIIGGGQGIHWPDVDEDISVVSLLNQTEIPEQHLTEYTQVCEHYRQGFRTIVDVGRLYLLFQAGLATAFSFITTHKEFQQAVHVYSGATVKLTILIISLIGLSAGPAVWMIARRVYQYHDSGVDRAVELEALYGMKLMTSLRDVWRSGKKFRAGLDVVLLLFSLIAAFWLVGVWQSIEFR
jgi:hypothetical protein